MSRFQAAQMTVGLASSWDVSTENAAKPTMYASPRNRGWLESAQVYLPTSLGLSSSEAVDVRETNAVGDDVFCLTRPMDIPGVRMGKLRDLHVAVNYNRERLALAMNDPQIVLASKIICAGMGLPEVPHRMLDRLLCLIEDGKAVRVEVVTGEFGPEVRIVSTRRPGGYAHAFPFDVYKRAN